MTDQLPPYDHEAERSVLGSMLLSPSNVIPEMKARISSADFAHPIHGELFDLLLDMNVEGMPADAITLTQRLRSLSRLDAVGGPGFITELFIYTPTAANAGYYAEIVREKSHLRRIWHQCGKLSIEAAHPGADLAILSGQLAGLVTELVTEHAERRTMKQLIPAAIERYQENHDQRGKPRPGVVPTGIHELDSWLNGGLLKKRLYVVAGDTSGGKSALAGQIALRCALKQKRHVLIVSYEMDAEQMVDRMVALETGVPSFKLENGFIDDTDFARMSSEKMNALASCNLHLCDDVGHWTLDDVGAEARAVQARNPGNPETGEDGLGLVVVDYLQLASPKPAQRGRQLNREREVADMSATAKRLSKQLGVPFLILSQLTDGKLRESRAIGHDADTVLRICEAPGNRPDWREFRLDKNRGGNRHREGEEGIQVAWNGPLMKFS